MWVPWREKWRHFAWPVRVLKSWIFKIWKKYQNPDIFGILPLFSDFRNSNFFQYPQMPIKVSPFFGPGYFVCLHHGGWGILQGLQVWNPNMKHTDTHISWQASSLPLVHNKSFLGQADLIRDFKRQTLLGLTALHVQFFKSCDVSLTLIFFTELSLMNIICHRELIYFTVILSQTIQTTCSRHERSGPASLVKSVEEL
jgi:hypothetical protein